MARISDNLERSLEMDIKQFVVVALAYLAGPIGQLGQPEKAAMLLAASESLMIEFGLPHQPSDLVEIRQFEAEIKAHLSKQDFQKFWVKGQSMNNDQAVEFALSTDPRIGPLDNAK